MKKSQAAFEFLSTYGWATVVVILAIGTVAYFGIPAIQKSLPTQCKLPSGITCLDHSFQNGKFSMYIRNNMGSPLLIQKIQAVGCTTNYVFEYLENDESTTLTLDCTDFKGDMIVSYTKTKTGLMYNSVGFGTGSGTGEIPNPSSPDTDEGFCRNANNYGLCDMLNEFTGAPDYKQKCCSEWSLCCT